MLIDIYMKFCEDSLNGFQVIADTILWQSPRETRAVVGQRSSPAGYILYCNIFIIKKIKMK